MTKRHAIRDERTIRALTVDTKATQLTDGEGLYLKLRWKTGQLHSWNFDFRSPVTGKRNTITIGDFPHIGLKAARDDAERMRGMVARGECPAAARDAGKEATQAAQTRAKRIALGLPVAGTFKAVAHDFRALKWQETPTGGFKNQWSDVHATKWLRVLKDHVFPELGDRMCADLTAQDFLRVLAVLDAKGMAETGVNARTYSKQVMDYAVVMDICKGNPVGSLRVVLKPRGVRSHYASCTTPADVAELLHTIDAAGLKPLMRDCILMHALTWQRPGNVRAMRWDEINFDARTWVIPSAKMKRRIDEKEHGADHVVPLPRQAMDILARLKATSEGDYVFPVRSGADADFVTQGAVSKLLARIGFGGKMTAHGFRAMARTLLDEVHGIDSRVLEAHLAHSNGEQLGKSYARATYLDRRVVAAQTWADYLDDLRNGAQVIQLKQAA
jgi:integrase